MLNWYRARGANARKAKELYGAVVTAARQPRLYREYGVPDTLTGRYEMIVLMLVVALERLKPEGAAGEEISRLTLEAFVTDMDDNMREMGVGDLSVPKKVKRAAAGFYERASVYRPVLSSGDEAALATAVGRFIRCSGDRVATKSEGGSGEVDSSAGVEQGRQLLPLAGHVLRQREILSRSELQAVLAGQGWLQ